MLCWAKTRLDECIKNLHLQVLQHNIFQIFTANTCNQHMFMEDKKKIKKYIWDSDVGR